MWPRGWEQEGLRGKWPHHVPLGTFSLGSCRTFYRVSLGTSPPENPHQDQEAHRDPSHQFRCLGKQPQMVLRSMEGSYLLETISQ